MNTLANLLIAGVVKVCGGPEFDLLSNLLWVYFITGVRNTLQALRDKTKPKLLFEESIALLKTELLIILFDIHKDSGLSAAIGEYLSDHLKYVPVTILNLVCIYAIAILTEFTSNVATVSIFIPIIYSLCEGIGIHPFTLALPATAAASFAFMLPVATPPNTIVFAKGRVRVKDMVIAGIPLNIIGGLIVLTAVSTYAVPLFGLNNKPSWMNNA
ncbi:unnamed protein product [Trichobilharzia szidati]|nr:unnamed protein product [Trichobilharzia szidati]